MLRCLSRFALSRSALAGLLAMGVGVAVLTPEPRPAFLRPSAAQIAQVMWRTVLARLPLEHFYPSGQLTTTSDGSGGNLTAEVGTNLPSDGNGQLVFFWHNNQFVGWDSRVESMSVIQVASSGPKGFRVTYSNYAPNDAACCPSLIPMSVAYRWSAGHVVAQSPLPMVSPVPGRVRLMH